MIDVLAHEGSDRRDVITLEGVDVTLQHRLLLGIERGERLGLADVGGRERRARSLQRAVDRGDRGVEQLSHLGGAPGKDLAQDQDRALPGGQVLQRGDKGKPDRVAGGGDLGGVGHLADDP